MVYRKALTKKERGRINQGGDDMEIAALKRNAAINCMKSVKIAHSS